MFSRNAYLVPSSQHPRAIDLDGVEILLHHQSGLYLAPSLENTTLFSQDNGVFNGEPSSAAAADNTLQRKPTAKKDRHSKINTAQGPRDRRVRLSIGIARKFFDLQEMLGFDKPSKTLDWLLTKSKEAIKDLVHTKQKASSSPSPSECDLASSESGADLKREDKAGMDRQQSRAKARARARERTLEKMCIKQLGGSAGSSSNNVKTNHSEAENRDLIEESLMLIKRKSKNPSLFGFQQNLVFSREMDSNYIIPSSNANENWDVFAFASHSILDQHKFGNSNSNI